MVHFFFKKKAVPSLKRFDSELFDILDRLNNSNISPITPDSLIDLVIYLLPEDYKAGEVTLLREIIRQKAMSFLQQKKYFEFEEV